ncbi:MAG: TetR/AcrR family transcriptional regulator [Deltaproteobacteria bacterium]|nr:TetR/AcrR family transcriptional regulator [Deltaproteobacteria bacterium]
MTNRNVSKEERRNSLLSAALSAFGKRGYHETQVSHIIKEAKVARGTFYLYFESKRVIFDELVTKISQKIESCIHPIDKSIASEIPQQILDNITRVTDLLLKNPLYLKVFLSDAVGLDREFDERLRRFYHRVLLNIQKGLNQGQELGLVRSGNTKIISVCLLGSLKEIYYQHVLGTTKAKTHEIVEEVYLLVLHAVVEPNILAKMLP